MSGRETRPHGRRRVVEQARAVKQLVEKHEAEAVKERAGVLAGQDTPSGSLQHKDGIGTAPSTPPLGRLLGYLSYFPLHGLWLKPDTP